MGASQFRLSMPPLYVWNDNSQTPPTIDGKINTNCIYNVLNTVTSDGRTLLPPYFIVGRTKFTEITGIKRPEYTGTAHHASNCLVTYSNNSGIKTENILDYINNVTIKYKQSLPVDKKMCIILDSANHHKNSAVLQLLSDHNIEILYIPPNCTGANQVNDLVVFSNVKAKARQQFAEPDMTDIIYSVIIQLTAKFLYSVEPYIIKYAFDYVCNADATLFYNSKNVFKHIKQLRSTLVADGSIVDVMLSLNTALNTLNE